MNQNAATYVLISSKLAYKLARMLGTAIAGLLVAFNRLESRSYDAVHLVLIKDLRPWQRRTWFIPTIIGANIVWHIEDNMDLNAYPYQPSFPMVFDKVRYQMVGETRFTLPMRNRIPDLRSSKEPVRLHT